MTEPEVKEIAAAIVRACGSEATTVADLVLQHYLAAEDTLQSGYWMAVSNAVNGLCVKAVDASEDAQLYALFEKAIGVLDSASSAMHRDYPLLFPQANDL